MKKQYHHPSVKTRRMESVMLDLSNQVGGTQLAPQPINDTTPQQDNTPTDVQGEDSDMPTIAPRNLWEEE